MRLSDLQNKKIVNINEIENMDNIIIVPSKYEIYYKI